MAREQRKNTVATNKYHCFHRFPGWIFFTIYSQDKIHCCGKTNSLIAEKRFYIGKAKPIVLFRTKTTSKKPS